MHLNQLVKYFTTVITNGNGRRSFSSKRANKGNADTASSISLLLNTDGMLSTLATRRAFWSTPWHVESKSSQVFSTEKNRDRTDLVKAVDDRGGEREREREREIKREREKEKDSEIKRERKREREKERKRERERERRRRERAEPYKDRQERLAHSAGEMK